MKRLADQTLYEILEVAPDAAADAIQVAYEKARTVYGPGSIVTYTLMEPDEAALLEARIEDARATLLDPERRARYDEALLEREAEPRAAVASGRAAVAATPPVIPPAPPPVVPEPARALPEEEARPAVLLERALEEAGPVDAEPARAAPAPIRLERIASDAAPGPTEPATATPPPTSTPTATPMSTSAATSTATATATDGSVRGAPEGADEGVVVPPHPVVPAAPPAPAPLLPDAWTGEALRQVREARGLSVQQICERTKVTRHHIENIEADRFSALPAQVYLRGILLTLARELRLDGQKVARSYIERIGGNAPTPSGPSKPR